MFKIIFTLLILSLSSNIKSCKYLVRGKAALGFQYNNGAAWAILCTRTPYGTIPGKLDGHKGAYYTWRGKEKRCHHWTPIDGTLYPIDNRYDEVPIPFDCKPRGYSPKTKEYFYNAIVPGVHGMVPGKASCDLRQAWYGWGWKQWCAKGIFYVIC